MGNIATDEPVEVQNLRKDYPSCYEEAIENTSNSYKNNKTKDHKNEVRRRLGLGNYDRGEPAVSYK